jgi:gliding motility-associated-like protein
MGGITNDTTFYVKAVSYGCVTEDSLKIAVTAPPYVTAMPDQRICYGDEITLAILAADGDDFMWNVPQTTFRPTVSNYYIVTATRPPCLPARDTVRITVGDSLYINPQLLPAFQRNRHYEQQLLSNAGAPLYTIVSGQLPPGILFHSDGSISGVCIFNPNDPTEYTFTIEILDEYGCTISKTYTLQAVFFIPLVFSPNGDGINDYFMREYKVIIYDRLGMKIFEGADGWDGICNNGKVAPDDTYYYILFYTNDRGEEIQTTGSITLLR